MDQRNTQDGAIGITLPDIVRLLSGSWKWMLGGAVAGGFLAGAYVAVVSPKYEASAIVRMAQVPAISEAGRFETVNVEAPELLVDRLNVPSIYSEDVITPCGLGHQRPPGEELLPLIRYAAKSGDLTITVRADAPSTAGKCATALFDMIRNLQAIDSKPLIDRLRRQRDELQARLADSQTQIAALQKSGQSQVAYLAARDELNHLWTRMDDVTNALSLSAESKMLTPVYVASEPAFPRRPLLLTIIAVLTGTLAGFLLAVVQKSATTAPSSLRSERET